MQRVLLLLFLSVATTSFSAEIEEVPDIIVQADIPLGQYDMIFATALLERVSTECFGIEVESNMCHILEGAVAEDIKHILLTAIDFKRGCLEEGLPFDSSVLFNAMVAHLNAQMAHKCANIQGVSGYCYISAEPNKDLFLTRVLKLPNERLPRVIEQLNAGNVHTNICLPAGSVVTVERLQ